VLVTAAFAAAVIPGSALTLRALEADLRDGLRLGASTVLTDYVDAIVGEALTVGVVGDDQGMRFVYLDDEGREISELAYLNLLYGGDGGFEQLAETVIDGQTVIVELGGLLEELDDDSMVGGEIVVTESFGAIPVEAVELDPVSDARFSSVGPIDLGDEVVAVGQTVTLADGTEVTVAVSSPLVLVADGMETIVQATFLLVPLLIVAVAAMTWMATTRALAPIDRVTRRARAITAERLSERLPVPPTNDEVRALVDTVNEMLARLEGSQQQQRRLIADASHELRSPVAASRAQLEVALSIGSAGATPVDWETTAKTVLVEQEQLSELVDGLLALSRLDESGVDPVGLVDVVELVGRESSRPRMPKPVVVVRPGLDGRVRGDETLLLRAVRNVVDNAARFAKDRVEIGVERTTGSVRIVVDDDGDGVAEADRERIFERFTRLEESRTRDAGGAGLGLAITRTVVEAHGGTVTCAASPLGGARFTLELPARPPEGD
jgi:signal transduction histidine kinase